MGNLFSTEPTGTGTGTSMEHAKCINALVDCKNGLENTGSYLKSCNKNLEKANVKTQECQRKLTQKGGGEGDDSDRDYYYKYMKYKSKYMNKKKKLNK